LTTETEPKDYDTPLYPISSAALLLGISVHTLRKYEKEGLILPYKKSTNHRLYTQRDIDRIKCIMNAISETKFSIPAIKAIYALIPCWSIINCSMKDREVCPAYTTHEQPCWHYKHFNNSCAKKDCRHCEVYNLYGTCERIKEGIKKETRL